MSQVSSELDFFASSFSLLAATSVDLRRPPPSPNSALARDLQDCKKPAVYARRGVPGRGVR